MILPLAGGVSQHTRSRYVPPKASRQAVGERLRWMMRRHGMKPAQACHEWAVEHTVLMKYFRGVVTPSYKTLLVLLHWGISIDWLLTGTGSPYAPSIEGQRKSTMVKLVEEMPADTTPYTIVKHLCP